MKQTLKQLIAEYIEMVEKAHYLLTQRTEGTLPLIAYRNKHIPKSGSLDVNSNITYNFHGVGCEVDFNGVRIDFDYGPKGRHDGFDVWRLHIFLLSSGKYPEFKDIKVLQKIFDSLIEDGLIACPEWQPSPHLCYLSTRF